MSDYFNGIISSGFKELYKDAIDNLIEGLSIACTLVYGGSKKTPCTNCYQSPQGKSIGKYKAGGPISFSAGICPFCHGEGFTYNETTSSISLCVLFDSKQWLGSQKIDTPNEFVQTISLASTYDELKNVKELIVDTSLGSYVSNRFQRYSEPEYAGLGEDSYIFVLWKRIG